jgi:hypothetical protein
LFNLAQNVSGLPGFWDADLTLQSHGEGFLTVLEAMFAEPSRYDVTVRVAKEDGHHAPNAMGNFCFEVTLGYRRLERGR